MKIAVKPENSSSVMQVPLRVLVFGQLTEHTGETVLKLPKAADTDALKEALEQQYPGLVGLKYSMALNKKIVHQNMEIADGDELALMPPFSGG
jgi:sulfur-carrier protein